MPRPINTRRGERPPRPPSVARADANSLATAAALRYARLGQRQGGAPSPAPRPLDLAARASELAPQNASIGWLHLQLCAGTPPCDIRDVATVMRWVDADNGAAWLQTLAVAQKDRDTTEVDRILADMAARRALRFLLEPHRGVDGRCSRCRARRTARRLCGVGLSAAQRRQRDRGRRGHSAFLARWWKPAGNRARCRSGASCV